MDSHDLVIVGGRVMDPESGMDEVRNVGITGGSIATITQEPIAGDVTIDASGLVVAPGFIDMHSHGQLRENYEIQVRDGVTTALELEGGPEDMDKWYEEREGTAAINYGASVGHLQVRMNVMGDPGELTPVAEAASRAATDEEIAEIKRRIERGLERGAVAVGFGIQYTPAASRWEVLEAFRAAAKYGACCHVHMRGMGHLDPLSSVDGLEEIIAAGTITGAPLHVCHISSTGLRAAPNLLQMIDEAQSRGIDVTTECYSYNAALTDLASAMFEDGWQSTLGIDYAELEWTDTGERLNNESFARYREEGGMVIMHMIPDEAVRASVASPLTAIASDAWMRNGKGHPRTAGTYSRVLGKYVREEGLLTLMEALRKMALMPAQRMEARTPSMRNKGRVKAGADADLVIFDASRVQDKATFREPSLPSEGIVHVLVNGVPVVSDSALEEGATPGRGVRAPMA